MGRKISFTLSANRLTFSNRSGGAFSIPVRTETTTGEDETTHAGQDDEQRQRMTFAEWCDAVQERQKKRPTP